MSEDNLLEFSYVCFVTDSLYYQYQLPEHRNAFHDTTIYVITHTTFVDVTFTNSQALQTWYEVLLNIVWYISYCHFNERSLTGFS